MIPLFCRERMLCRLNRRSPLVPPLQGRVKAPGSSQMHHLRGGGYLIGRKASIDAPPPCRSENLLLSKEEFFNSWEKFQIRKRLKANPFKLALMELERIDNLLLIWEEMNLAYLVSQVV